MGLRERKKERTRRDLQRAAIDLFAEKGYDHVTVADIADRAEISPRTFYRYYKSKDDLVLAPLQGFLDAYREVLAERPAEEPPLQALRESFVSFAPSMEEFTTTERVELVRQNPELHRRSVELTERWQETIASDLAARGGGGFELERRLWLASGVAMTAGVTALRMWVERGSRPRGLADEVMAAFGTVADLVRTGIGLG
jgi:AcrR family transcriptional regulator